MNRRGFKLSLGLVMIVLVLVTNVLPVLGHESGGYLHDSEIDYSNPDWMASLPDSRRLSNLSIPGTHDTMSFHWGDSIQTQSLPLSKQLDAGIRVFDIRISRVMGRKMPAPNGDPLTNTFFTIVHGKSPQKAMFGKHVLKPIMQHLQDHPTETVLMIVREQCPGDIHNTWLTNELDVWGGYLSFCDNTDKSKEEVLIQYLNDKNNTDDYEVGEYGGAYGDMVYGWNPIQETFEGNLNPTLGDIRGKIVILDGLIPDKFGLPYPTEDVYYPHNDLFKIQDYYKLWCNWDLLDKWDEIWSNLLVAHEGSSDVIYIHYLSGAGPTPGVVFPYFVASGHWNHATGADRLWTGMFWDNITGSTCGSTDCYPDFPRLSCVNLLGWKTCSVYYEGTNELTYSFLQRQSEPLMFNRWGIIMADFPGKGLIDAVIQSNFPSGWARLVSANGPYEGDEGSEITFTASPPGTSYQYKWSWHRCDRNEEGACIPGTEWEYATEWSNDPTTSYTWNDDWIGTGTMQITDGNVTHNAEVEVVVNNVPPGVSINTIRDETGADIGNAVPVALEDLAVSLVGSFTDAGSLDTHTASMDWGDGTTHNLGDVVDTANASHVYVAPGDYTVTLTVTDDDGGVGTDTRQITVVDANGALSIIVDMLRSIAGDLNIAAAMAKLEGRAGGAAQNGAIDLLEKGNLNAALEKIKQAMQYLEAAETADPALDLTNAKSLLALTAKSIAVDKIAQAEAAATKPKELMKIQQARDLVIQGDIRLVALDYVGAVFKYQQAVREVQGRRRF